MAYGGGTIVDPDTSGGGVTGSTGGSGVGGNASQPTGGSLTLAQMQPAGGKYSTPYFGLYTNSGDMNGAIPAVEGNQRVRLVDPATGQVLVEGSGMQGAQQIATLANAVSNDMGRKASWQVQYEFQPDQFTSVGSDRADPKHNLLATLVQVAAPLLGAAIPGLAPALGAALGGFGGSLATGGNLKQALLSAATSGIGNAAGGALSNVLRGVPVSLTGVNPLGGVLGRASDALSGLTSGTTGAGTTAAAGGSSALNSAMTALPAGVTEVSPVTAWASAAPGALSQVTGSLGTALGSLAPGALTSSSTPGQPQQPGNEVDPVTVTANSANGGFPIPALPVSPVTGLTPSPPSGPPPSNNPLSLDNLQDSALDIAGQTVGQVGADLGVYGLAQLLGMFPNGGMPGQNLEAPGYDTAPDVGSMPGTPGTPGTPDSGIASPAIGASPGAAGGAAAGAATPNGGYGGGALGQALGAANFGGGGSAGPTASAPDFNVRGSTAPDIYPWRKPQVGAEP